MVVGAVDKVVKLNFGVALAVPTENALPLTVAGSNVPLAGLGANVTILDKAVVAL